MIPALAALALVTGALILVRRWRTGRGGDQFILALLPIALLALTLPIPVVLGQTIAGFRTFARAGTNVPAQSVALMLPITRALLRGAIGFCGALVVLAVLQFIAMARASAATSAERDAAPVRWWPEWWLGASSLLAAPVAAAVLMAQRIPRTVVGLLAEFATVGRMSQSRLQAVGTTVPRELVGALLLGLLLSIILVGVAIANVAIGASHRVTGGVKKIAWSIWAIVFGLGLLNCLSLSDDIRWLNSQTAVIAAGPAPSTLVPRSSAADVSAIDELLARTHQTRWFANFHYARSGGASTWAADVYLTPERETASLRRGHVLRMQVAPNVPLQGGLASWEIVSTPQGYAQVPTGGPTRENLDQRSGANRPFLTLVAPGAQEMTDEEIVGLEHFIRTSSDVVPPAERTGAGGGSALATDWPISSMNTSATNVQVYLTNPRSQQVVGLLVRKQGTGWTVLTSNTINRRGGPGR